MCKLASFLLKNLKLPFKMSIFGKHRPEIEVNIGEINVYFEDQQPAADTVHLILTQTINQSIYQIMALTIASNQKSVGTLGLVDTTNPSVSVTGTFSNVTANSSDPNVFTAAPDVNNNVVVAGVAEGTADLTVSALCNYTDSTGATQSVTKTVAISVTITKVITADSVDLQISFGTPSAQ